MNYHVEGVVLRSADYGEGHAILTLYTRELGKVSVMARGAKKVRSRHTAAAQPFTVGQYHFFKGSSMGTLNSSELVHSYHALRTDLTKAAYASYLVEMTERMVGEQEPFPALYDQLKLALDALAEDKDAEVITLLWQMKMLQLAGYTPQLWDCAGCGEETNEPKVHAGLGGIVCRVCSVRYPDAKTIAESALKLLRTLQRMNMKQLGTTQVSVPTKKQMTNFMNEFMDHHLGIRWKSRTFIEQLNKFEI